MNTLIQQKLEQHKFGHHVQSQLTIIVQEQVKETYTE